jgi:OOP family OmpA-OmpF porin
MKTTVMLLSATVVAISVNSAIAESGDWYIGAGAGPSFYNDWSSGITAFKERLGVVNFNGYESTDSDDIAFGYKLFGGYNFNDNFAVELSYIDMGKVDANSSATGTFYDAMNNSIDGSLYASANANVDAFTLDVSWGVPMTSALALIVKGGAYYANTDLELKASSDIPGTQDYNYTDSESSNGLHFGIGVNFKMTDAIGLRAEWERLYQVEARDGKNDVDLLSAAVIYHF